MDLTYGLFVLSSAYDGKASGAIINTAIQVTDTPLQVAFTVNKSGYTGSLVEKSGIFNLSIIDTSASFDLFRHFGFQSGRETDKFAGYEHCAVSENGLYYVTGGTNALISGKVVKTLDLGTHMMFIGEVTETKVISDKPSASYSFYHENIKPKPGAAPKQGKKAWRCTICGYIYEHEYLPPDYICPICKHPASDFEEITI